MSDPGGLFSQPLMPGGVMAFKVKNLDTGESVHLSKAEKLVPVEKLMTFDELGGAGAGTGTGSGSGSGGATAGTGTGSGAGAGTGQSARSPTGGPTAPFSVVVTNAQLQDGEDGKPYTSYTLVIKDTATGKSWDACRRYTDFVELDKMIRATPDAHLLRASLPPKKWFGNLSRDVVRERQAKFEAFLRACVAMGDPMQSPALRSFLNLGVHASPHADQYCDPATVFDLPESRDITGLISLAEARARFPELAGQ